MAVSDATPTASPTPTRRGSNLIKALAAALMVVDHIGAVFFPETLLLRYLGRLSFPLFSWLLAQGERRTRQVYRYGQRLLLFGLISQPVYSAVFQTAQLNVLFTLLVGLVTLRLGHQQPQQRYWIWPLGLLLAAVIPMDGSAYGVAMMLLMAHPMDGRWWSIWLLLHGALAVTGGIQPMQLWALPAPLIILLLPREQTSTTQDKSAIPGDPQSGIASSQTKGDRYPSPQSPFKRWFYWFYPGHLLALWLVRLALSWR